jgi:hypothetical protein
VKLYTVGLLAMGLAVVVGVQRPDRFDRAPTCVYVMIRPDSLYIASFAPPCNPTMRPADDTVRTWRLPSQSRTCSGHLLIDALGAAQVAWADCGDGIHKRVEL